MSEIKDWWDRSAQGYQSEFQLPVDIHYGPSSPNEDELQLLGEVCGRHVLELGCGGAQCSVAFALRGAKVTGVDFSSEQLKFARSLAADHGVEVEFIEGSVTELSSIADCSQDIVFSAFTFMYIEDRVAAFKEAHRVLKAGGIFAFSVDHPMFRQIDPQTLLVKEGYFADGPVVDDWGEFGETILHPYTVSSLFDTLMAAGFAVQRIIEPDSRKRYSYDPWFGHNGIYVPRILDLVPPTIIFKSLKV